MEVVMQTLLIMAVMGAMICVCAIITAFVTGCLDRDFEYSNGFHPAVAWAYDFAFNYKSHAPTWAERNRVRQNARGKK